MAAWRGWCRGGYGGTGEAWALQGGYDGTPGGGVLCYGMGWLPAARPAAWGLPEPSADPRRNPTVIYDNWLVKGNPAPPAPAVGAFLSSAGIRTVISGHQPHGDAASSCVAPPSEGGVAIVSADTSYSRFTKWDERSLGDGRSGAAAADEHPRHKGESRGVAVSELILVAKENDGASPAGSRKGEAWAVTAHGVLANGMQVRTMLLLPVLLRLLVHC